MKVDCSNYTEIALAGFLCTTFIAAFYLYIDYQFKMAAKNTTTKSKITVRVLALGFAAAYSVMLFPTSKETLDFQVYGLKIELYYVLRAIMFLGVLVFSVISGGTALSTFIKGKTNE